MFRGIVVVAVLIAVISPFSLAAVINFPDPGLEAVIREVIDKPSGGIYDYQLEDLGILDASGRGITNLEGIQYCKSLSELDLRDNAIADLGPLSNLIGLTTLDLSSNEIVDLVPLSSLAHLTILRLGNNHISELEPLAGLAATDLQEETLKELQLDANEIVDLSALAGLTSLQKLVLNDNQIDNIAALASLTNLALLSLMDNQIVEIGALAGLVDLKVLLLDNNQIAEITALSGLENLFGLWLSGNPIVSRQPLVDNPGLGFGDRMYICSGQLDLTPGSLASQHLLALTLRGVYVYECW